MALSKITNSLLNGFQTSTSGAISHCRAAIRINTAVDSFDALNRDNTRTRGEKAPMYQKLKEQHGAAIKADMDKFAQDLMARTESYESQVNRVLKSVSMKDAIQTVVGLKAGGLSTKQIQSVVANSPEIAIAMARAPQELSGWTPEVSKAAALKHYPDLVTLGEENLRDFSAFQSLSKVAERTILYIGLNVDEQALAARFDEAKLTPAPEPKTMAEQNALMGKVDNTEFDKATEEQIAEHVGIYGATHIKGK